MSPENNIEANLCKIGKKLADRRHSMGLKIAAVSQSTGISKTLISQIENGRYKALKYTTLLVFCDALGISVSDML